MSYTTPLRVINPEDGNCKVCRTVEILNIQCGLVLKAKATQKLYSLS
jgi:hypothetical protein